ncbi:MAG TPA: NAD+ synthase [Phycisphaerae bacterium]|nr:NAD+ synthase [Phycisphaerae bacterium]
MKIAAVQLNPTIGDVEGNTARILDGFARATSAGAELVVLPEQSILGYPAKDLLLRREVIEQNLAALQRIVAATAGLQAGVIVGFAEPNEGGIGRPVFNSAAFIADGQIVARSRKRLLPTYDIFDEARYFEPGGVQPVIDFRGRRVGVMICEDMWSTQQLLARPLYDIDPPCDLAAAGADLLINISASPYYLGKHESRLELMAGHARRYRTPLLFCNQVGGNDELLFDGVSSVVDATGRLVAQAKAFEEDLLLIDLEDLESSRLEAMPTGVANLRAALVMGLRDYMRKCRFTGVVVGLSGGLDSAVVACLAAEALGPPNVLGVAMPSRYSSEHSVADAKALAENLGIDFSIIPIEPLHAAFERELRPHFAGRPPDVTEENIQARIRGVSLMALSNKFGRLLLTTGNKSELAVGYCTLYGDMCGGLALISDVPKTMVYELAHEINRRAGREVVPRSTLTKPPSAELRPNQTDQDSLPPYEVLDEILARYEERLESIEQIVAAGFDSAMVTEVVRKIHLNEYKRQQAAPGLKVTSRAFGFGRRMPIAARLAF